MLELRTWSVHEVVLGALLIVLASLPPLCTGCAPAPPTQEELAAADYGAYPANYKEIIKAYIEKDLIDPYSARYEFLKGPAKMWTSVLGKQVYGYGVCATVNAKNRFGGYVGRKLHFFLIRNGGIVEHGGGGDSMWAEAKAEVMCEGDW